MAEIDDALLREAFYETSIRTVHLERVSVGSPLHIMNDPSLIEFQKRIAAENDEYRHDSHYRHS